MTGQQPRHFDDRGVTLVRGDGAIVLLDAIPVPAEMQQQLDALCAMLRPAAGQDTATPQDGET